MMPNLSGIRNTAKHQWRFSRLGGFDQVQLNNAQDLKALPELDQKLWAALSCPAHGLQIDTQTLAFLDTDSDDRIRAPEIVAAVQWVTGLLKEPDDLLKASAVLPLNAINDTHVEGQRLLSSAREILKNLDKSTATVITLDDLADMTKIFANTRFNGDGIIPVKAADNDADKQLIEEIISCYGSEVDRCGDPGITQDMIDHFFAEAQLYADWWRSGESLAANVPPFNKATETITKTFTALKSKIDDFFTRCQLVEFDPRAGEALNPATISYEQLNGKNLADGQQELAALPLAQISAGGRLPLKYGLNPAWIAWVEQLHTDIVMPLYGDVDQLTYVQWQEINAKFAGYLAWQQKKQGALVELLGINRITHILAGDYYTTLTALVAQDQALAPEAQAIESVKKLLHYCRDLYQLLNNFVNFHDFYAVRSHGIFQAGTLYLDGRSCQLCIRVEDIAKHATMAALSGIYLAYCECRRAGSGEKINIAAAVTGGDADNLMLGRNGIFYDRDGLDWDATIVKIIEHPISVAQAFWSPYKRFSRMLSEQIEKFAAAKDKDTQTQTIAHAGELGKGADTQAPPPFDVGRFAGIFAAIGLAVGAIGTAIAAIISGFLGLPSWQMPLAVLGIVAAISGPSMLMAYLKLRQRNLAPVLDASGWAVNAKAYINIPFGRSLTGTAKLPANAVRQLFDPFAEKASPWRQYVILILLIAVFCLTAIQQGFFTDFLHLFGLASVKK
ncbi:MAG: hypothetical protein Q7U57_15810 [Methylovulum sp.]|nr:hypothetical protein [Methylovulum sp.]